MAAAATLPLAYLFMRSIQGGVGPLIATLFDGRSLSLLARTVFLTVAVTFTAAAIGVSAAWLTSATNLPGGRFWTVAAALPLVVPSYVAAYSYIGAFGPRGALQGLLEPLGVEQLPQLYGFTGAWIVLSLFTYPYVFLSVRSALTQMDPSIEEAALTLTKSRGELFFRLTLPHLRPAILSGCLLVALYVVHDFGAVSLLRYDTFTRAIYLQYLGSFDRTAAATLSLALSAITLVIVGLEALARGRGDYFRIHGSAGRMRKTHPLGRMKWPAFGFLGFILLLAIGIPASAMSVWLYRGIRTGAELGLTGAAAANSLAASLLGAVLTAAAAVPVAMLVVRSKSALARVAERASFMGYALPGVVVALSLVFFGARVAPFMYQTMAMLLLAYLVLFLPLAVSASRNSLLQVPPRLEDAARTLGTGKAGAFYRVVFPLMRPGLVTGTALVFLTAMKELPATLLLAPIGFKTLATEVWSATNVALFSQAALPALALILLSSVPLWFLIGRTARVEGAVENLVRSSYGHVESHSS